MRPLSLCQLLVVLTLLPCANGACSASFGMPIGGRATPVYEPVFVGTVCQDDAYDAAGCPVPGACGVGTTDGCLLWRRGVFVTPPGWVPPSLPAPPSCSSASDAAGAFASGVWTPANTSCRLACFTPPQAARLLAGKRVLFAGDSMMRQLFAHTVAFLRELDVVEQPFLFHNGALYRTYSNGTDDLCVATSCLSNQHHDESRIRLRFEWSPRHVPGDAASAQAPGGEDENVVHEFGGALLADAVVVGLLFHLPENDTLATHTKALSDIASKARVLWLTTPGKGYTSRNSAMRAWATAHPNASVLALDRLAVDGTYTPAEGPHFTCSVDVHADREHQNACKDVHDTVNGNLMQMMFARLATFGWGAT